MLSLIPYLGALCCQCRIGRRSIQMPRPIQSANVSKGWQTWLKRAIGVAITIAIFAWMLRPVVQKWDQVGQRVKAIDWPLFGLAAIMFAAFLLAFRVLSWRTILAGFGYRLPLAPATRIWSTS